jgi:NADP-dependent 3-hydroxy acid dehydrogenase YdfG
MSKKVWFITGCTSGFGSILCRQLLERGESVVATARKPELLDELKKLSQKPDQLLTLKLDVTNNEDIKLAVNHAIEKFGRIDVLINNAGFGHVGALEEITENDIRRSFDTNVFGLIEVTRAVLPTMRNQQSGYILNLSSVAGIAAIPGAGIYAATKFAVEGLSEALAAEIAPFNIKLTLIEPGAFRTQFANGSLKTAIPMKEYDGILDNTRKLYQTIGGNQPGDPDKAAKIMIELVDHPTPPLRLVLGGIALKRARDKMERFSKEMMDWEKTSSNVDF